jgi:hypothetical protein
MNRDELLVQVLRKAGHSAAADLAATVIDHHPTEEAQVEEVESVVVAADGSLRESWDEREGREMLEAMRRELPNVDDKYGAGA